MKISSGHETDTRHFQAHQVIDSCQIVVRNPWHKWSKACLQHAARKLRKHYWSQSETMIPTWDTASTPKREMQEKFNVAVELLSSPDSVILAFFAWL